MKNKFQSKAVPRGTRTIWRYLGALFILFTFAIGNVWGADLTAHVPGVYEKTVATGGYGCTLTTVASGTNAGTFEVYYFSAINKYSTTTDVYGGGSKQQYRLMCADNNSEYQLINRSGTGTFTASCDWIEMAYATTGFSKSDYTFSSAFNEFFAIAPNGGNADITKTCYIKPKNGDVLTLKVSGYVEFAILGSDNGSSKYMTVTVDGGTPTSWKSNTLSRRSVALTTGEHTIVVANVGSSANAFYGFSLKLPSCAAGAPGNISKGTLSAGVLTLNAAGSAASGDTWYWQSSATGTDKTNSGSSFDVSAAGTYYIRSYNTADDCWSNAKSITISATDLVANYTVKYMDGTTEVGSETVEVGQHPTGSEIADPTKDCYTFAGWSPALSTVTGTDGQVVNVNATWTANYFTESVDFEEGGASAVSGIASKNIVASAAGEYDGGKESENWAYKGWKIKSNAATVKVLVQANKKLTFKLGYLDATAHVAISGDENNYSVTGASKVQDDPLKFTTYSWTKNYDALYTFTTGSAAAAVIKALTVQDTYTATRVDGKSDASGPDANVLETTLPTPTAISGWTFIGWVADQDVKAGAETKTASTILPAGTYTLLANTTFTAQWAEASSTYDVTYVSAHGTAPADDNAASVVLAELSEEGWAHKGWTANADVTVDAATVEAGTLIANGKTAILASNVTFTAVWKEIFTVTFDAKGGSDVAPIDVEDGATLTAAPSAPTKDNYVFQGWSETDGGDVVADITAITISDDKTFYAIWALDVQVSELVFSNSFKGWIHGGQVEVFYMAGESAPTLVSYDGKNLKAEGAVVISDDKVIATGTDDSKKEYDLTMTAVSPLTTIGAQTFDGTEGYVKTRHAWTAERKWKMSKYAEDGRVARGETSMYIFLGAAESVTFDWGKQQKTNDVAVYVNGTFVKNLGKDNNSAVELTNGNNMVAFYSLQTSGDVWLNGLTTTPWVPVTAVTLKEGEAEISSKEIWASTSFTLTAEVTPDNASNKTITWTSSNDAVATVVNGVVTGVAASADPVTITASTVDGVTATCEVTVTVAPEPSADPVITAQPASANYYEGATIAALEVVAIGESLTYQWYLGSDPIDGATSATYTPTVTAIGSYVYHCVVTNTEAGKLPTSLASANATVSIAEDPAAIKLLDGEGEINTTNFTTGVTKGTVTISEVPHNCAVFGSTGGSIVGLTGLNKVVAYNATTTQTKVKFVLYNENNASKELYLQKVLEGATEAVTETISVPSKELYETQYYTYNSSDLRSFYVTVNSTNIKILQVTVVEDGTVLKRAGEVGYELNLNQGRVFGAQNAAVTFEGLAFAPSSNAKVLNSTELPITTPLSFSIAAPLTLKVETSAAKYYVSQNSAEDGTTATAVTEVGEKEFDLTVAGTWYIVPSTSSAVKLTNIAFSAPKCAGPAFNALTNSDICSGDPYVALDGTATVADGGTPTYKWYAEGADESDPAAILGTDATYTPTADGKYYVIATNHKEGFADNEKKSDLVTVTTYASAEITTAPADVRQTVGENATLTVVATGKAPLSYQWYTCDENGDNAVLIAGAEEASYTVNVTANLDQFYKVVVTSGCGEASAVAHVVEWVELPQVNVNATTTWDWVNISDEDISLTNSTTPEKNEECVLANVKVGNKMPTNDETFNSQALLFYGEHVRKVESGRKYATIGHIKFTTTVAGKVTVEFSDNGNNNRKVKINDAVSESSTSKTDVKTFSAVVTPGEVNIEGVKEDGTGNNQYIRISKIIFSTTDVEGADYVRDVSEGRYGTICLPNGGVMVGAEIFTLAYYGATSQKFFFDEVPSGEMEAGKPYLFLPREGATQLGVYYTDAAGEAAKTVNGFVGFIGADADDYTQVPANDNCYIISNNLYRQVQTGAEAYILSNRAYIDMTSVTNIEPAKAPGARRIGLGVQGKDQAQGFENIETGDAPMKVMINGTMYILRGEKVYDATGRLVK